MLKTQSAARSGARIAVCAPAAIAILIAWSTVHAAQTIQEHRAADPQGEVEISNIAGMVEVDGWDKNEVEVAGTASDSVHVDVKSTGNHTSIHVVSGSAGFGGEARLIVHVPAKSAVAASLVSSDFKVAGVQGALRLQTVSGDISGEVGGDLHAGTVSGDVRLTARAAKTLEIRTISGRIQLTGGGGDVDISTVSGKSNIELSEVTRGRFKSVSGNVNAALALTPDGEIEGESVSGDISVKFAAAPKGEVDVQTFSGDIKNCFGPKPVASRYGAGSRLQFETGDGHEHVRVVTKSGDVQLCVEGASGAHTSSLSLAQARTARMTVPYVY
jgi:DUF4097 and DUF4098 domain-containing protein YvlB